MCSYLEEKEKELAKFILRNKLYFYQSLYNMEQTKQ